MAGSFYLNRLLKTCRESGDLGLTGGRVWDFFIPVLRLIFCSLVLLLFSCRDGGKTGGREEEAEVLISYSREVRPVLLESCVGCHERLPLHDPRSWDLLHAHEGFETPDLVKKWVEQGKVVDEHWAGGPLRVVEGATVDDFVKEWGAERVEREVPAPLFGAPVEDLLAGDFREEAERALSTGYFRQGDDTPEWRAERAGREFYGIDLSCARCHDHPREPWTTERYRDLVAIFTTPYDDFRDSVAPVAVVFSEEGAAEVARLKGELSALQDERGVEEGEEGIFPTMDGMVAAFSFDGGGLKNEALLGEGRGEGIGVSFEEGVQGGGASFGEDGGLFLRDFGGVTEMDSFSISLWVKVDAAGREEGRLARIGERDRGFEWGILDGKVRARWVRFWPQWAASVTSEAAFVGEGRWMHLAMSYDGSRRAEGVRLFLNGLPVQVEAGPGELVQSVTGVGAELVLGGPDLVMDEVQVFKRALGDLEVRQLFDGRAMVEAFESGVVLEETAEVKNDARVAKMRELVRWEDEARLFLVMSDWPEGEGPRAERTGELRSRLEMAERLNRDLLARSLANQVWKQHFGVPLAHGLGFGDFLPSHPDLLEWLAGKLKASDFDVAALGELIRESKGWEQAWPELDRLPATCPRTGP